MSKLSLHSIYRAQAEKNLRILEDISREIRSCTEWQITICFYAALHLVKAHLAHCGFDCGDHTQLFGYLSGEDEKSTEVDSTLFDHYQALYKMSRRARYLFPKGGNPASNSSNVAPVFTDQDLFVALGYLSEVMEFSSSKYGDKFRDYEICTTIAVPDKLIPHFQFKVAPPGKPTIPASSPATIIQS
jgi:hypothetical protein